MRSLIALTVAATALAATAASANVTVVRSAGASARNYPPGTSLPESATLRLGAGDTVMVLGARGTRTFRGPGAFRVGAPVQAQSIAQAIGRPTVRSRVGAVRGGSPGGSDIWNVDISRGGNVCVLDTNRVQLWRPRSATSSSVVVRAPDGTPATVEFAPGRSTGAWPASVPIRPSGEYRIGGEADGVSIRLIAVQPVPSDDQETATLLIRNGCEAQLERLLAATPEG